MAVSSVGGATVRLSEALFLRLAAVVVDRAWDAGSVHGGDELLSVVSEPEFLSLLPPELAKGLPR